MRYLGSPAVKATIQGTVSQHAICAIAYSCFAIALLTLNPFQFQAYDPAEWWVWRFRLVDVVQNILLFLPLGILLRQGFRFPLSMCLLGGFLLSFSVESAQLLIANRTSNYMDLMTNSSGTLLGAWLGKTVWGDSSGSLRSNRFTPKFALAMMLLPICWARAMILEGAPHTIWLLVPTSMAGLMLLHSAKPKTVLINLRQSLWLLLGLMPLVGYGLGHAFSVAGTSFLGINLLQRTGLSTKHFCIAAIGIGFGISASLNGAWLWQHANYVGAAWYNLRWMELLLWLCVLLEVTVLQTLKSKMQDGQHQH